MLFGHQNNDANKSAPEPTPVTSALNPLAVDPTTGVSLPVPADEPATASETSGVLNQASGSTFAGIPLPPPPMPAPIEPPTTAPLADITPEPAVPPAPAEAEITPQPEPTLDAAAEPEAVMPFEQITPDPVLPEPVPEQPVAEEPVMPLDPPAVETPEPAPEQPAAAVGAAIPTNDELFELKQQALAQLSPLVDQLDQTPEEKFRTKMMMIQSTDDQSLIKEAYEAAQQITDEKVRAQALLDVINEINYFTAQHQ